MIKFSKRKSSKILSVLLAITMLFAFLPTTVFAAESNSVSKLANGDVATVDDVGYATLNGAVPMALNSTLASATVATVGDTECETLAEAVQEVLKPNPATTTIVIVKTINLGTTGVTINGNKAITLNLNGNEIKYSGNGYAITLSGGASLTVTDKTANQNGKLLATGGTGAAISNFGTGNVTVSGGTVEAKDEQGIAIYNGGTAAITVSGGTVRSTGESGTAISNSDTGNVNITGGTVEATGENSVAINNNKTGAITVSGGTVQTTGENIRAIYNSETGKITISGTALVTSKNTSTTGGTIFLRKVPTTGDKIVLDILCGTVSNTATPEGYSVYFADSSVTSANVTNYYNQETGSTLGKVYPSKSTLSVAEITNGGTTTKYPTLQDAVDNAINSDEIKVIADIDLGTTGVTINGNKSITLDLNGQTVTYSGHGNAIALDGGASLTVTDKTANQNGKLLSTNVSGGVVICNNSTGTVTVSGGTIESKSITIYNVTTGNVIVSGGTVITTGSKAILNTAGNVSVSGGAVKATSAIGNAILSRTGKITISGTALVTSVNTNTNSTSGTIHLLYVPSTGDKVILDIHSGTVENTATPECYSVYFADETVTPANVTDYYKQTAGAKVGKVYPSKSPTPPSKGGSYSGGGTSTYTNHTPQIISGAKQSIVEKNNQQATFRIDRPYVNFLYVESGKTVLVKDRDYTVKEGSTIVTLLPAYTNTLPVGTHKVRVEFIDGYAELEFEVKAKTTTGTTAPTAPVTPPTSKNPQTGDSWFAGLFK